VDDDRYTYPGSSGVLINRFNIRNSSILDEVVNREVSIGLAQIYRHPPASMDWEGLKYIHQLLFSRVFTWAGKLRTVDVTAVGTGIVYCRPEYIQENLDSLFSHLRRDDYLRGHDTETFVASLARFWGELSAIHPFRDGNTRSQSAYITLLAREAGHPLNWQVIDVDRLRTARLQSIAGRTINLKNLLQQSIEAGSAD